LYSLSITLPLPHKGVVKEGEGGEGVMSSFALRQQDSRAVGTNSLPACLPACNTRRWYLYGCVVDRDMPSVCLGGLSALVWSR